MRISDWSSDVCSSDLFILVRRQRRIDPIPPRVTAEQDDLENARTLARPGRILGRLPELIENDFDDAFKLALLDCRKVIEIGAHGDESSGISRSLARANDRPNAEIGRAHV